MSHTKTIGIDTFSLSHGRTGYGLYLMSISAYLKDDNNIRWTYFGHEVDRYTYIMAGKNKYISPPSLEKPSRVTFLNRLRTMSFYKREKLDAVIYPAASICAPILTTIPSTRAIAVAAGCISSPKVAHALRHCSMVIAPSMYIKGNLIAQGVKESRILTVYSGVDHSLFFYKPDIGGETTVISPFSIKRPYFIYPSRGYGECKRHIELIRAFTLFKERTHLPHRLVLSGCMEGDYSDLIQKAAFTSSVASDIFITGFFPHESMPDLYRGAAACIFPADYEGAGLTVMEAMAVGVPVACSDSGALPEITGGNAVLFNSRDMEAMAHSMEVVANRGEDINALCDKGMEWVQQYSWDKTANIVKDSIVKLLDT